MLPQVRIDGVINRQMIGRHQFPISDRSLFGRREILGLLRPLKGADRCLVNAVRHGIAVPDRHAAAALIEKRNPQANKFHKSFGQLPVAFQGAAELHQSERLIGAMREVACEALFKGRRLIGARCFDKPGIPLIRRDC